MAGPGAAGCPGGRVAAAGAGWAWLDWDGRPVHLTGAAGPMLPVTVRVARVPVLRPGARVALEPAGAAPWRPAPRPESAPREALRDACRSVAAHRWTDPWALRLGVDPFAESVARLVGRGPGLTPAGDDALLGHLLAAPDRARAAAVLGAARGRTTAPSLALLRWAARGVGPEPAERMLAALLTADGAALGPALRGLAALGGTTGRAILTGLVAGLSV